MTLKPAVCMEKVWEFLSVSTAEQAESLPDQQAWVRDTAAANGWEITRTFKGVSSGAAGVRKIFKDLIAALESTPKSLRPTRVMMIRLDRSGRGFGLEAIAAMARIYELGVKFFTRQDGDISITKASDTFAPVLRLLTGACENEAKRDKALRTYAMRRASGMPFIGSRPPYGLKWEKRAKGDMVLVVDEARAAVVRKAFELRVSGLGTRSIAQQIYADNPPPIVSCAVVREQRPEVTRPLALHQSSILAWIRCKTYRGTVVSEELWDQANAVKNRSTWNEGGTKHPWPLGGAIRCECGKRLTVQPKKSSWTHGTTVHTYQYRYYMCDYPNAHQGRRLRHKAEKLEDQLPVILTRLRATQLGESECAQQFDKKRKELQHQVRAAEERSTMLRRRQTHAWDSAADGMVSNAQLTERLAQIEGEIADAHLAAEQGKAAIAKLHHADNNERGLQDLAATLATHWAKVPAQHKRQVAQAVSRVVGGLTVGSDGVLKPLCDLQQDRLQR